MFAVNVFMSCQLREAERITRKIWNIYIPAIPGSKVIDRLPKLKEFDQDEIPLIQLQQQWERSENLDRPTGNVNNFNIQDSDFDGDLDLVGNDHDSDKDPEFNVGSCEVERCKKRSMGSLPHV